MKLFVLPGVMENWRTRYVYLLKLAIFTAPILFILAVLLYKQNYGVGHWFYRGLAREDGLMENGTSIAYLVAIPLAYAVARFLLKTGRKLMGVLYLLLAVAFFIVAMEEISWGQRMFDIETPESMIDTNYQSELNIHNLKGVNELLPMAYVVVGLLGGLLWVIVPVFRCMTTFRLKLKLVEFIETHAPNWYLTTYFIPVAIYYILLLYAWSDPNYPKENQPFLWLLHYRDQEPVEFFLALGFLFSTLDIYLRLTKKSEG